MINQNNPHSLAAMLGAPSPTDLAPHDSLAEGANLIAIGDWMLTLPHDWMPDQQYDPAVPYFESLDGTRACYVTPLSFDAPLHRTAAEIAEHIQSVQKQSLQTDSSAHWRVMHEWVLADNGGIHSILDLFDHSRRHRVLNKVIARIDRAVQLTLHDYYCDDYDASTRSLSRIADSLHARRI